MAGRRRVAGILSLGLLVTGAWLLGTGAYMEGKALLAQLLLQQAWDETRHGGDQVRPWPWADTWPLARLRVERLGVDQVVLAGASGRTLAFGPGHVAGSSPPGNHGNSVISGHRDTHFRFLRDLEQGDVIELELPRGGTLRYAVYRLGITMENDQSVLDPWEERLTLVTCYPFDALVPGGPGRYLVLAEPLLL